MLAFALVPADLLRVIGALITALFIHGGWAHAGMNAVGALAFGAPASRYLGLGGRGVVGFFLLFLVCGVLSSFGYALLHLHDTAPLAGASGAVSGLLGASTRLIERRTRLSPLATRTVVASTFAWIVINAMMGVFHYAPGMGEVRVRLGGPHHRLFRRSFVDRTIRRRVRPAAQGRGSPRRGRQ